MSGYFFNTTVLGLSLMLIASSTEWYWGFSGGYEYCPKYRPSLLYKFWVSLSLMYYFSFD